MDLSPNDIRSYEFSNQMRGYDKDAVDTLLDQAADALEALKQENLKLSMEIDSVKGQLAGLRQFEDTIKSAAIDARRNADMTVETAKKEAQLLVANARTEAQEVIGNRSQKISDIENQISKLQLTRKSYMSKLRSLINSHLEIVDEITSEDAIAEIESNRISVTDSSEVEAKKRETVATQPGEEEGSAREEAGGSEASGQSENSQNDEQKSTKPVDPELAEAIRGYRRDQEPPKETPKVDSTPTAASPAQGQWVETTKSAEDIPDGFHAMKPKQNSDEKATDKVKVPDHAADTSAPEKPEDNPNSTRGLNPSELAGELDNIAAKFEEEMDKADKS